MPPETGFTAPAAVVAVVQAMPADAVRRVGAAVVDEDQVDPVADDEVMARAGCNPTDIALEALGGSSACRDQEEADQDYEDEPCRHLEPRLGSAGLPRQRERARPRRHDDCPRGSGWRPTFAATAR